MVTRAFSLVGNSKKGKDVNFVAVKNSIFNAWIDFKVSEPTWNIPVVQKTMGIHVIETGSSVQPGTNFLVWKTLRNDG